MNKTCRAAPNRQESLVIRVARDGTLRCTPACSGVQLTWPLCAPSCPLLEESMLSSFRGCAAPPRVAAKTAGSKRALLAAMGAQLTWIKARHVPCPCRVYRQLLLRGLRCRERSMPRVASTDTTQHPRFGVVSLRPIKPVGSSENGLNVAVAACQAGWTASHVR